MLIQVLDEKLNNEPPKDFQTLKQEERLRQAKEAFDLFTSIFLLGICLISISALFQIGTTSLLIGFFMDIVSGTGILWLLLDKTNDRLDKM